MSKVKINKKELFQSLFERLVDRKRRERNSVDKQKEEVRQDYAKTVSTLKGTVQKYAEYYYNPYIKPVNDHFQKVFPGWLVKIKAHLNETNEVEAVLELVPSDSFIVPQEPKVMEMLKTLVDKKEYLGIDLEAKERKATILTNFLSECSWEPKPMNRIIEEVTRGLNDDDQRLISELLDRMGTTVDEQLDITGIPEDAFFTEKTVEGVI